MAAGDWGLIGNERAVRSLQAGVPGERGSHAYLFLGAKGVGRSAAARRLAQVLNCTGDDPPCLECNQCTRIAAGIHADVQTLTITEDSEGTTRKLISVEQVREMEKTVALNPYEGRTRVVVIDPADLLSDGAQNAFLKTLEEPPPHVVLILIAGDAASLLETIRSRCTLIEFRLVPTSDIEAALVAVNVEQERARLLARLAGGRPGWALAAAADEKLLERRRAMLDTARSLPEMPVADRMDFSERLTDRFRRDREAVVSEIEAWETYWRDVLLVKAAGGEGVANLDLQPELEADAAAYATGDVVTFLRALGDAREHLASNVQPRMALDALLLQAPRRAAASR